MVTLMLTIHHPLFRSCVMQVLEGFLFVYNLCPNLPVGIEIEFVDFE